VIILLWKELKGSERREERERGRKKEEFEFDFGEKLSFRRICKLSIKSRFVERGRIGGHGSSIEQRQ